MAWGSRFGTLGAQGSCAWFQPWVLRFWELLIIRILVFRGYTLGENIPAHGSLRVYTLGEGRIYTGVIRIVKRLLYVLCGLGFRL